MPRYHPIDALFDLQRALEASLESDWLRSGTAGTGSFPPINVFQQGDTLVAILQVPGSTKFSTSRPRTTPLGSPAKKNAYPQSLACIGASV
jgi:hypothetical protein